jgi:hypothetical protein
VTNASDALWPGLTFPKLANGLAAPILIPTSRVGRVELDLLPRAEAFLAQQCDRLRQRRCLRGSQPTWLPRRWSCVEQTRRDKADAGEVWRGCLGPHLVFTGKYETPLIRGLPLEVTRPVSARLRFTTRGELAQGCRWIWKSTRGRSADPAPLDVAMTLEISANARLRGALRWAVKLSSSLLHLPYFAAVLAARDALTRSGQVADQHKRGRGDRI